MDTDKNRSVDKQEFVNFFNVAIRVPGLSTADYKKAFDSLDINDNGELS